MKDNQLNTSTITGDKALLANYKSKNKPTIDITSLNDLSFENLLDTDLNKFSAKVANVEKKVFAAKGYLIEISISSIPSFKVSKTYNEFKAFYKALKQRFTNMPWPDFPSQFGLFAKEAHKIDAFNQILQNICNGARLRNKHARSLLAIFYAFFLDKEIIKKIKQTLPTPQIAPEKEDLSPQSDGSINTDGSEADSSQLEGVLAQSIMDFEKKFSHILRQKSVDEINSFEESKNEIDHFLENAIQQVSENSPQNTTRQVSNSPPQNADSPPQNALEKSAEDLNTQPKQEAVEEEEEENEIDSYLDELEEDMDRDVVHRRLGNASDLLSQNPDLRRDSEDMKNMTASQIKKEQEAAPSQQKGKGRMSVMNIFNKTWKKNSVENNGETAGGAGDQQSNARPGRFSVGVKKTKDEDMRPRARGTTASGKEIPNFSGTLFMKLSTENKWTKYFVKFSGSTLLLFKSMLDNDPLHFVPIFRCNIKYSPHGSNDYFEIWHAHDAHRIQFTVSPDNIEKEDIKENDLVNLGIWHDQVRIASEKVTGLELLSDKYAPIGKFQVVIYAAFDIKGLPNNASCYVKLSHPPFHLSSATVLKKDNCYKWKQSFFLPIFDQYFPMTFELICAYSDGWLNNNKKEEVICTGEVLVADIMSLRQDNTLTYNIPLKYTEAKAKLLTKNSSTNNELEPSQPKLEVRIVNLSSVTSLFASTPTDNYVEGTKIDESTMSKQLIKLGISRLRRVTTYLSLEIAEIQGIFNFKYPFFSYVCLFLFLFMGVMMEIYDIIPNLILLIVFACIYHHPKVHTFVTEKMIHLFFQEKHLNPNYMRPRVKTYRDLEIKKFMNTERWKYRLVDPESLVSLMKKFKNLLVTITILLTKAAGFLERFKNIVTWQDPMRTIIFIVFSTIGYCVLSVISFRFMIVCGILANFARGVNYYKNMYKKNNETAQNALRLILKEFYPDHYIQIFGNLHNPWPTMTMPNFIAFETKMVEKMKERINVNLPDNILRMENKPIGLLSVLATCGRPLKLKMTPQEEASLHIYKPRAPKYGPKAIYNFIMNIPSDYYRILHPRAIPYERLSKQQTPVRKEKGKEHQE